MNMHAYCYEHAWILSWACLYTAMNMPVYCHEHAWRLYFQFFCKGKVCKTFPGVGSIAGSYYNFIFNIVGNNSVLHSNYTILHSFQLSTRVQIPPDPYRHVSFFCLSVLVFVCPVCKAVSCCDLDELQLMLVFTFPCEFVYQGLLIVHCFGQLFSPEDPGHWKLHLQRATAHSENTCKKKYIKFLVQHFSNLERMKPSRACLERQRLSRALITA